MQLQAITGAAKAVGENDVSAGLDKALVQRGDALWVVNIPELRGVTRQQADIKQIAASGAIGQQPRARGQQVQKAVWEGSRASGLMAVF